MVISPEKPLEEIFKHCKLVVIVYKGKQKVVSVNEGIQIFRNSESRCTIRTYWNTPDFIWKLKHAPYLITEKEYASQGKFIDSIPTLNNQGMGVQMSIPRCLQPIKDFPPIFDPMFPSIVPDSNQGMMARSL
jgi:hypothetical protein